MWTERPLLTASVAKIWLVSVIAVCGSIRVVIEQVCRARDVLCLSRLRVFDCGQRGVTSPAACVVVCRIDWLLFAG